MNVPKISIENSVLTKENNQALQKKRKSTTFEARMFSSGDTYTDKFVTLVKGLLKKSDFEFDRYVANDVAEVKSDFIKRYGRISNWLFPSAADEVEKTRSTDFYKLKRSLKAGETGEDIGKYNYDCGNVDYSSHKDYLNRGSYYEVSETSAVDDLYDTHSRNPFTNG